MSLFDGGWLEPDPAFARHAASLAARASWLVGDVPRMEQHVDRLREHARDVVDRLRAEEIVVTARIARAAS
ncbi:MAG: hypothetical protein H6719_16930 [Sandaracinaceae bacterium]|nr:hypothetical protein [Sandaracinaceae bacterium]